MLLNSIILKKPYDFNISDMIKKLLKNV